MQSSATIEKRCSTAPYSCPSRERCLTVTRRRFGSGQSSFTLSFESSEAVRHGRSTASERPHERDEAALSTGFRRGELFGLRWDIRWADDRIDLGRQLQRREPVKPKGVLWHALRHTYASMLAAGGVREDVVAVLMGHKRGSVTSLYTHLFADAFEGVEEALAAALDVNEASTNGRVTTEHREQLADTGSAANGIGEGVPSSLTVSGGVPL